MILVYDLEIQKSIKEVGGWGNAIKGAAGIACAVAQDPYSWKSWIFLEDNLSYLPTLLDTADVVVTWNGDHFDDKILENSGLAAKKAQRFDILANIRRACRKLEKGWTLGETVERNLPAKKMDHGYEVPIMWQQKKVGKVLTHCARDTWLTCCLLNKIRQLGYLTGPNNSKVRLSIPPGKGARSTLPIMSKIT